MLACHGRGDGKGNATTVPAWGTERCRGENDGRARHSRSRPRSSSRGRWIWVGCCGGATLPRRSVRRRCISGATCVRIVGGRSASCLAGFGPRLLARFREWCRTRRRMTRLSRRPRPNAGAPHATAARRPADPHHGGLRRTGDARPPVSGGDRASGARQARTSARRRGARRRAGACGGTRSRAGGAAHRARATSP
ncbi:MAG: hypothetical protein RI967_1340 [Planctomycetota bacterium]